MFIFEEKFERSENIFRTSKYMEVLWKKIADFVYLLSLTEKKKELRQFVFERVRTVRNIASTIKTTRQIGDPRKGRRDQLIYFIDFNSSVETISYFMWKCKNIWFITHDFL